MNRPSLSQLRSYAAKRLGLPGGLPSALEPVLVASSRRAVPEMSFHYTRMLWWFRLVEGPTVVSVAPELAETVAEWIAVHPCPCAVPDGQQLETLTAAVRATARLPEGVRLRSPIRHMVFGCDATLLRPPPVLSSPGALVRIRDTGHKYADRLWPPEHCLPDGVVFGVVHDDLIVSIAYAHRIADMEHEPADLAVETAAAFRRRGYGRAAVHGVTAAYACQGREAWYECSPENAASQALARSVGYQLWAQSLTIACEPPD